MVRSPSGGMVSRIFRNRRSTLRPSQCRTNPSPASAEPLTPLRSFPWQTAAARFVHGSAALGLSSRVDAVPYRYRLLRERDEHDRAGDVARRVDNVARRD